MTTDYKVTELFYIIDEFCKHFDTENAGNLLEDNSGVKRRRRQALMSMPMYQELHLLHLRRKLGVSLAATTNYPVFRCKSMGTERH
mgnify:CR=1 FL=1